MEFIYVYLTALALAIAVGKAIRVRWVGKALPYVTGTLIFFMGMWAGNEIKSLPAIGMLFLSSAEILVPSLAFGYAMAYAFKDRDASRGKEDAKRGKLPYAFMACAAFGWVLGSFVLLPNASFDITALLIVLVIVIGIDMAPSITFTSFKRDLKHSWIPFSALAGALLGGAVSSLVFGLNVKFAVAASAGLGWYSLDGPLVSSYFGPTMGMVAFMVNFLREQITFFAVPALRGQRPGALLTIGGSTTMDDTLSLYAATLGDDYKGIALFNGLVLSLILPFLLPAILSA